MTSRSATTTALLSGLVAAFTAFNLSNNLGFALSPFAEKSWDEVYTDAQRLAQQAGEAIPSGLAAAAAAWQTTTDADAGGRQINADGRRRGGEDGSSSTIPIQDLVRSTGKGAGSCGPGFVWVNDTHLPPAVTHAGRKIPKIVHVTSKTRCVTPPVFENLQKLHFANHSFYFHDDEAVDRLFQMSWTLHSKTFPELRDVRRCVTNGAAKSDLWRYLVLWEYGGIYTDLDNTPRKFDEDTIRPDDDAFFVTESLGIMSQFFMASSRRHPLWVHTLNSGLRSLRGTVNVMVNNPAKTTGPSALKNGFIAFQQSVGVETNGYVDAGVYFGSGGDDGGGSGAQNRSVTLVGTKTKPEEYIDRDGVGNHHKMAYYKSQNISHFHQAWRNFPRVGRISCQEHIQLTNGTDKVANYRFSHEEKKYVDATKRI